MFRIALDSLRRAARSNFVRSTFLVVGGTAAAQSIGFAFSPIITRLYGPEAFGVLGVFSANIAILTPLTTMAFAQAIAMPAEDKDAAGLVAVSIRIAALIALCSLPVFIIFGHQIAGLLGAPQFHSYLWLLSPVLLFAGVEQVMMQWLIRKTRFRSLAYVQSGQALILGAGKTLAGLVVPTGFALIVAATLGRLLNAGMLLFSAGVSVDCRFLLGQKDEKERRRQLRRQFSDFPRYRTPQNFLNAASRNVPIVLFSTIFGPAVAGFYALGQRVLQLPLALVSQSVGKVLLPRLAAAVQSQQPIRPLIRKATLGLFALGIVPFGLIFVYGPDLFQWFFGQEWREAGLYARWLVPWLFFGFVNVPAVQALPFSNSQGFLLAWEIITTGAKMVAILYGGLVLGDVLRTIQIYAILGAGMYVVLMVESYRRADVVHRVRSL